MLTASSTLAPACLGVSLLGVPDRREAGRAGCVAGGRATEGVVGVRVCVRARLVVAGQKRGARGGADRLHAVVAVVAVGVYDAGADDRTQELPVGVCGAGAGEGDEGDSSKQRETGARLDLPGNGWVRHPGSVSAETYAHLADVLRVA